MESFLGFITSCLITLCATPFVVRFAHRFNLIDDPDKRSHPANTHKGILPRAGGLAIYLGIIVSSFFFLPIEKHLLGIFTGITVLLIMGLLDDRLVKFSPYTRLLLLLAPAAAAVASGIGISFISNPLQAIPNLPAIWQPAVIRLDQIVLIFDFLGPHKIILLADIFAFLWIITLTQVVNWSKGVDGQMPGITLVAAITLGIYSLKLYGQGDINQLSVAKLSFITAGASLGFLIVNWHPAKILPGFSASTILAFMLAVLSILSGPKVTIAFLVLAIPIADFIYTLCRRTLAGKSPFWGDRGHLHHRLLDILGWSPQQISLFYILGSAILGAVALLASTAGKIIAIILALVFFIGLIVWLNFFGDFSKRSGRDNG